MDRKERPDSIDIKDYISRNDIKCCGRCKTEVPKDVQFSYDSKMDFGNTCCHLKSECGWWTRVDLSYVWPFYDEVEEVRVGEIKCTDCQELEWGLMKEVMGWGEDE